MPRAHPRQHLGLAFGQLGDQRLAAAKTRRAQQHRRGDRGRALGDPGIGHLQRRGGADRPVDDPPVDPPIAQYRGLPCRRTRGVDRRAVARPRRPADDPAIDKIGAGRCDDLADADRGLRADRVAVDIDRLAVERLQSRRQTLRQRLGFARRQDRQKEIGAREQRVLVGCRLHPRLARALGARGAAARQQRADFGAAFVKAPADAGPHHPLRDDRDNCHSPASSNNSIAAQGIGRDP